MQNPKWVDRFYNWADKAGRMHEGDPPKEFFKSEARIWTNLFFESLVILMAAFAVYDAVVSIVSGKPSMFSYPGLQMFIAASIALAFLLVAHTRFRVAFMKGPIVVISQRGVQLRQWSSEIIEWDDIFAIESIGPLNPFLIYAGTLILLVRIDREKLPLRSLFKKPSSLVLRVFFKRVPLCFCDCVKDPQWGLEETLRHFRKSYAPEAEPLTDVLPKLGR